MPRVSEEIQQRSRFDRPERELAVTLLRTGDVARHAVERALDPLGASPEQYNVLRILRGARGGRYAAHEIARRMVSRSPNITRLVDKMAAKGLVRRERVESDRRVVVVSITTEGRQALGRLDQAVNRLLDRLGFLSRAEMRSLVERLDQVRDRLRVPTLREGGRPDRVRFKGGESSHG